MTRRVANHTSPALVVSLLVLTLCGFGCSLKRNTDFQFVVAADMRGYTPPDHPGPGYFAGACAAIRDYGPGAFIIVPGDLDPPQRVRATLSAIVGPEYVWYPVLGNHEFDGVDYMPYLRECNAGGTTLPGIVRAGPPNAVETCYSFDHGIAHFVVVNQYYDGQSDTGCDGDVGDALYEWLAADLAANDMPVVFVVGHEPTVAMPDMDNGRVRHQGDSLDKYPEHNHRFWTLLRQHDVVAYICGHTHDTSVAKINGVWQLDAGHARGLGDTGAPSTFMKIAVTDEDVRCQVYRCATPGEPYQMVYEERLR